jgi:hypothetical protein
MFTANTIHQSNLVVNVGNDQQVLLSFMPLVTRAILRRELLWPLFMGCGSIKARSES